MNQMQRIKLLEKTNSQLNHLLNEADPVIPQSNAVSIDDTNNNPNEPAKVDVNFNWRKEDDTDLKLIYMKLSSYLTTKKGLQDTEARKFLGTLDALIKRSTEKGFSQPDRANINNKINTSTFMKKK